MSRAPGSRSSPIRRRPGNSVKNRSACPPAPRVASTRTAPDPSECRRVRAGVSSSTQRCSRTGTCPKSPEPELSATATPPPVWRHPSAARADDIADAALRLESVRRADTLAPRSRRRADTLAPRSVSEGTNLALGKYARVGSGRGHDARARASDNVAECFIAGRGEVLFGGLLVVLPGLRVPNLEEVDRPDHHAVLGQVRVTTVVSRQGDPALRVGVLLVRPGGEIAQERPRFGIAPRGLARPAGQLLEFGARVDGQAVILALGDHQPPCQRVAELGGQRQPPLVVEFGRVGAEKHQLTSPFGVTQTLQPPYPTIPHFAPLMGCRGRFSGAICHLRVAGAPPRPSLVARRPPHDGIKPHF